MSVRKCYSKEFKLDAVSLAPEQSYTSIEAASSLDIRPDLFRRWVREHQTDED